MAQLALHNVHMHDGGKLQHTKSCSLPQPLPGGIEEKPHKNQAIKERTTLDLFGVVQFLPVVFIWGGEVSSSFVMDITDIMQK